MLWRNGCDGKVLRCGAGDRHQQRDRNTGTHRAVVPRGHKEETDGGGRYRKKAAAEAAAVTYIERGAAQQAAVTETERLNRRPAAVTRSGRPLQAAVTGTMPWGRIPQKVFEIPPACTRYSRFQQVF
jgi:hypothetical protein